MHACTPSYVHACTPPMCMHLVHSWLRAMCMCVAQAREWHHAHASCLHGWRVAGSGGIESTPRRPSSINTGHEDSKFKRVSLGLGVSSYASTGTGPRLVGGRTCPEPRARLQTLFVRCAGGAWCGGGGGRLDRGRNAVHWVALLFHRGPKFTFTFTEPKNNA